MFRNGEAAMMECRQSKRLNLKVPLRVFRADTKVLVGHALDVSLPGIKVASDCPFDVGQEKLFDLEIPNDTGQWRMMRVKALSIYSIRDATGNLFYTGFKFVHIEPESLLSLQKLIDDMSSFS